MSAITVIGCDGGPLPPGADALLAGATLVVGAARHLDAVKTDVERIVLGNVAEAVTRLSSHDGHAVVLASGDPGFFGIVATLRRAGLRPAVVPAPSSVAHAFARIGLPWDDALVVSAHGRDLRRAVNACRAHRKVAVLTAPGAGPRELAEALTGIPRRIVVVSRLGMPDERITGPDGDWADPNVVLVLGDDSEPSPRWVAGTQPGPAGWALPEAAFAHRDSMITKAEVRALALARLGPRLGDLVWDIGAGSGSVAVECARLGAAVIAVERDADGCERVRRNAAAFNVDVTVVGGNAPDALAGLPDPDAVFVGGGGASVLVACLDRSPDRVVAAYAAVERVGPALEVLTVAGYRTGGTQLQANRLAPLPGGVHRLEATNPVYVVWGERS
ncbi:precorrin-6y C5,15-methyltransferase (decarboxylating) subunit CbiE [Planosporangium flavigriseum]|uniref:Precorrin-6y C5,15-methyltransferase subunit CbiE n=1 Tax=Planosporangium flavigriseum TaxID=373681 RepID=A0A8J3LVU7_9ACTN|nr:precorrin-6y C5,15-methyltransferase (decarboxylating) subunit CbiE [Planosporangium flavigriseum]NJC66011.1 precorrin-6y C5,15-methyltransferase (decarboxylating) subunit CbiE [Planosporangium flavigriseum]GIG74526.1 precorrin-6y C5,15-methyltransferase subunit CbiE [Planosporangium flavigriseum]